MALEKHTLFGNILQEKNVQSNDVVAFTESVMQFSFRLNRLYGGKTGLNS